MLPIGLHCQVLWQDVARQVPLDLQICTSLKWWTLYRRRRQPSNVHGGYVDYVWCACDHQVESYLAWHA